MFEKITGMAKGCLEREPKSASCMITLWNSIWFLYTKFGIKVEINCWKTASKSLFPTTWMYYSKAWENTSLRNRRPRGVGANHNTIWVGDDGQVVLVQQTRRVELAFFAAGVVDERFVFWTLDRWAYIRVTPTWPRKNNEEDRIDNRVTCVWLT